MTPDEVVSRLSGLGKRIERFGSGALVILADEKPLMGPEIIDLDRQVKARLAL
jgi:hypothetical protein